MVLYSDMFQVFDTHFECNYPNNIVNYRCIPREAIVLVDKNLDKHYLFCYTTKLYACIRIFHNYTRQNSLSTNPH